MPSKGPAMACARAIISRIILLFLVALYAIPDLQDDTQNIPQPRKEPKQETKEDSKKNKTQHCIYFGPALKLMKASPIRLS